MAVSWKFLDLQDVPIKASLFWGDRNSTHLAILCDLFGMLKWPFGKVKWPPTKGQKGHFESPGIDKLQKRFWFYPIDGRSLSRMSC